MKFYIGIDDAGRGPVIGPMVLAGILVNEEQREKIKKLGVKDSKLLFAKEREELFPKIKEISTNHFISITSSTEIDNSLETGTNLNKVEAIKTAKIINELTKDISGEVEIIVDCPSTNIVVWKNYVNKDIQENPRVKLILRCEHKADLNHPVVSAASILAKITRDAKIEEIKKEIGIDFGSGYPSDPLTVEFLKEHALEFKDKGIFRKTWSTWKNQMKEKQQKKLGEF
ncbi:MAG: ribonuclease HII [archaeon]